LIEVEFRHVQIPFRFRYGHAAKQHSGLEAVVCIARDEEGREGFGEAVPRTYVTGETCESVMAAIPGLLDQTPSNIDQNALRQNRRELATTCKGAFSSCACCAIDTALYDLLAQQDAQSCAVWSGAASVEPLVYSASIGISKKAKLLATLLAYRFLGFKRFKVKVGNATDLERIRFIRRILGSEVTLFADANASWDREEAISHIEALQSLGVWAIEEPLKSAAPEASAHGGRDRFAVLNDTHYENYRWLRNRSPLPLIADESLICLQSAERIVAHQAFDILNIRLSKCGGPWVSTQIVELARENGLKFALGAMVGETPILATAGAHFALVHKDHLYVQGFSHRLLHGKRFASGEPSMRRGQVLIADRPGLGLQIDKPKLDALTLRQETVEL